MGLDTADLLVGGPADSAGVVAAQVEDDAVLGVGIDSAPDVDPPEGHFLLGDHDHSGIAARRWKVTGSAAGRGDSQLASGNG